MATSIRVTIRQAPGMAGVETSFAAEAIVDNAEDAHAQGAEVFRLIDAFETGMKEEAGTA